MPRKHRTRVSVPDYEINAFEELRSSACARFLQQAAGEASAEAGHPADWYRTHGTIWLIRRTTITHRSPARLGDALEIATWVADFRRVRSRRDYEVRNARSGELLATASTDWVYLELGSGRLRRIPPEMITAFLPEGEAPSSAREPLALPEPPRDAFASRRIVEFRDLDGLMHVNNAVYVDYLEEANVGALAARGWPPSRALDEGGYLRATFHDVEYLREARYGDELECLAWSGTDPAERLGEIRRAGDGTPLVKARSRWTWIDRASRAPAEMPQGLAAALGFAHPRS